MKKASTLEELLRLSVNRWLAVFTAPAWLSSNHKAVFEGACLEWCKRKWDTLEMMYGIAASCFDEHVIVVPYLSRYNDIQKKSFLERCYLSAPGPAGKLIPPPSGGSGLYLCPDRSINREEPAKTWQRPIEDEIMMRSIYLLASALPMWRSVGLCIALEVQREGFYSLCEELMGRYDVTIYLGENRV